VADNVLPLSSSRVSTFDPVYKTVADSWKRASGAERKDHFFAQLDFTDGQAIFAKVGIGTLPDLAS